jgi:hypothetical protein
MHAWDEPAERLFSLAPEGLVMPRLGQAIEPVRAEGVVPWWRGEPSHGKNTTASLEPDYSHPL